MSDPIEQGTRPTSQLLFTLEELVEASNRPRPRIERIGEPEITADANRLRACAIQRIALLRRRSSDPMS